MAKNVLFLIHGVGKQQKDWSKNVQVFLADELKLYPGFRNQANPIADKLEFREIVYNDVFDGILKRWKDLAAEFDPVKDEAMPGVLASINQFLGALPPSGSKEKNNDLVDRAGDVLLYRGLTLVRRLVLLHVAGEIAKGIAERSSTGGDRVKFGVLGHSLGTTVAHDALQVLSTTNWLKTPGGKLRSFKDVPDTKVAEAARILGDMPFGPGNFRLDATYMVSNTSALLYTTKNPHKSLVRPPVGTTRGITGKFVNINHKYDPIGYVRPFDISRWPKAVLFETAIDLRPRHVHEVNVHDLKHYLSDPEVHAHIFHDLVDGFGPDDFGYALLRKQPQANLTDHPFPKYKGQFDREEIRQKLKSRVAEEMQPKLMAALEIVKRKVPEGGS